MRNHRIIKGKGKKRTDHNEDVHSENCCGGVVHANAHAQVPNEHCKELD